MSYDLVYSEALVKSAVARFWRRSIGLRFSIILSGYIVWVVWQWQRGDHSWVVGAEGTVALFGVAITAAVYVAQYRNAMRKFRHLKDGRATMRFVDGGFRFETAESFAELSWKAITDVWQYPHFWLLIYGRAHFSTLPLASLDDQARKTILDNVVAAGGRIR